MFIQRKAVREQELGKKRERNCRRKEEKQKRK